MKACRALACRGAVAFLLWGMSAAATEGQGTELAFSAGPQLSDAQLDRFGTTRGRVEIGLQGTLARRFLIRGALAGSLLGEPPCPAPPESQTRWDIEPGTSFEGLLDVGLALPVGDRIYLEPFAGTGVRYLTEADTDDPSPFAFGLGSSARMLVSGGATAYAGVSGSVRAFARVRLSRHFMGSQTLRPRQGAPIEREIRDLNTASLTAGLAIGL
jgi:hypothetical protein